MPAANARPGPRIGQALGPLGLNMAQVFHWTVQIICNILFISYAQQKNAVTLQFCKEFNQRTDNMVPDVPVPTILTAYANRTFEFVRIQSI